MPITGLDLCAHLIRRPIASPHISQQLHKNGCLQSVDESPTSSSLRRARVMPKFMRRMLDRKPISADFD